MLRGNLRVRTTEPITDPVYGGLFFTADEYALFQTPQMRRLRSISLGSELSGISSCSVQSNRFWHSAGAMYLAKVFTHCAGLGYLKREIEVALLAHDSGHTPFCHLGQHFLKDIYGLTHEEVSAEILTDSEFSREARKQGVDTNCVAKLVLGQLKPYSDLVAGEIDFDNLDNVKRFCLSTELARNLQPSFDYDPVMIAKSYRIINGELYLHEQARAHVENWLVWRKSTYNLIYSPAHQRSVSMLFRAMEFARREEELPRSFFMLNDAQAFDWLATRCNLRTRRLVEDADSWKWFVPVYSLRLSELKSEGEKSIFQDRDARNSVADKIAEHCKIKPEEVSVYFGKNKGRRVLSIPFIDEKGEIRPAPVSPYADEYHAYVFMQPKQAESERTIATAQEYMHTLLGA